MVHTASRLRAWALRSRCLSLANTCSIGFRSGEYFGSSRRRAPTARKAARTSELLWHPRLSAPTTSPGRSAGASTRSI